MVGGGVEDHGGAHDLVWQREDGVHNGCSRAGATRSMDERLVRESHATGVQADKRRTRVKGALPACPAHLRR
eukprot:scaffold42167_cov30-Tisochrysis_lutea.AAC.4